jgi:NTE family protein
MIDNQVRSLRKRQIMRGFTNPDDPHQGAYWGIRSNIEHYQLDDALPCPHDQTLELAATPTRLKRLSERRQMQLINWGYAICDAALRKYLDQSLTPPDGFPYGREL